MEHKRTSSRADVVIEAPSAEQIAAAKRIRRQWQIGLPSKPSVEQKNKRRAGIEGVALMILGMLLVVFLHPLGSLGWIIAALPFLGGVVVMLKSWEKF